MKYGYINNPLLYSIVKLSMKEHRRKPTDIYETVWILTSNMLMELPEKFDGTKSRTCGSSTGYVHDDIEIIDVDDYWINRRVLLGFHFFKQPTMAETEMETETEAMNIPPVDHENSPEPTTNNNEDEDNNKLPEPENENENQSPPGRQPLERQPYRRDRDSRERRNDDRDRDYDHRPYNNNNRRNNDYNENINNNNNNNRNYRKRGASPNSPPPPPYRDRHRGGYSPPPYHHRRSPPFKRYRRDDAGGYEGRRGGGGGGGAGFNPTLCQSCYNIFFTPFKSLMLSSIEAFQKSRGILFGHDDPDNYHYHGGRGGYPEDRPRGRFGGRFGGRGGRSSGGYQGGPPDWDLPRGGYNDAAITHREGLMSYKQFIQELEDDVLPSEAERRYQEYKSEYISTQKRAYFDAHKGEDWLKDKYHPTNLLAVIERRNDLARKLAKEFLLDLQSGSLDLGPGVTASSSNKLEHASNPNSEDEVDAGGKRRYHGRGLTKDSDPFPAAPKAHPVCSEPRRIQIDIEQAQALVKKLDQEKGVEDNILSRADNERTNRDKSHSGSSNPVVIIRGLTSVKGLEGVELLDTLITYLWRIHGLDYYGLVERSEAKGYRHVRVDGKTSDDSSEWEKKLDSRWQERLSGQDPLETMTAKEKIDATASESLDPYVRKIRDEKYGWKYGCGAKGCTKLFHASEFVQKHLKLKHPELVMELTAKLREDLYFQNYMNDEEAPGGKPVMQPSFPKDRPQRRRPGGDNRMRDERGYRRENDNRGNDGERFDRDENEDSMDLKDGGSGNPDDPMFDNFGGQGLHAGQFSSEIPPPVLMPVPGAGPLGPFVPAPPEVAMRMLRDQGGPSPFEGGGRNGRSGPQLGGPAPIIALPPSFRQDPRRLRSYQDLDAPEDEVTVIDYRSL
nr:serrate RNA effector molecule [Tanacetum cinerariifolium]